MVVEVIPAPDGNCKRVLPTGIQLSRRVIRFDVGRESRCHHEVFQLWDEIERQVGLFLDHLQGERFVFLRLFALNAQMAAKQARTVDIYAVLPLALRSVLVNCNWVTHLLHEANCENLKILPVCWGREMENHGHSRLSHCNCVLLDGKSVCSSSCEPPQSL
ncbi:hypothetical protein PSAB6_460015 [Paraburkholderia sabiae]|nr:hypothetical protein PSAB6_460015 [Paraburkholderia sabiae]